MRFNKHYRYNYGCDKHINDFLNTEISWVCLVHSSYFEENPLNEIYKTAAFTEITTMLFWKEQLPSKTLHNTGRLSSHESTRILLVEILSL